MAKRPIKKVTVIETGEKRDIRSLLVAAAVAIGIIGLGLLIFLNVREPPPIRGAVVHSRPARGHDNTVAYEAGELPPVGGTHFDTWQNCGIYTEEIDEEHAIHALEHGAVWITYNDQLSDAEVTELHDAVGDTTYLLTSPFPTQRSPIVMTVWGIQLELDSVSDSRFEDFIERYRTGPQTPERGASCDSGVGNPQ